MAAWDLELRGRYLMDRERSQSNYESAVSLFRQAIEEDPEYALPWAGIAQGISELVGWFYWPDSSLEEAKAAAQRAIELDPNLAQGYFALGDLLRIARRYDEGEAAFRRYEAECLRATAAEAEVVVACGGGTPVDPANRAWMREHGRIVLLRAPLEMLRSRLELEGAAAVDGAVERPLAGDGRQLADLFAQRGPAYEDCDLAIDVTDLPPAEVVRRLVVRLAADGHEEQLR